MRCLCLIVVLTTSPALLAVDILVVLADTAGIHHDIALAVVGRETVVAIAGHARLVGHQRIAGPRKPVEQRGLADVGPAHQREHRQHRGRRCIADVFEVGFVGSNG